MKKILKKILQNLILIGIGGSIYVSIEMLARERTHWTMFFLGGVCFFLVGLLNEYNRETPLLPQCLQGGVIITVLEFMTGMIVNVHLGWDVWDYSNIPGNLYGQICLPFTIIWVLLSYIAIILDDYIRYKLFGGDKPTYNLM